MIETDEFLDDVRPLERVARRLVEILMKDHGVFVFL
jgi:hypothetical protein